MELNSFIDHTILKADANESQIEKLCQEACEYQFYAVCVNPYWVKKALAFLSSSKVKVCSTIGFPLGASATEIKCFEAIKAIDDGASEVDMVINISAIKSSHWEYVLEDITKISQEIHNRKAILKVILETCLLSDEEKLKAIDLAMLAGVDFVKTSTGFSTSGATVRDVMLIKSFVGNRVGIKASGGIKDFATAKKMIQAGASRIGTSNSIEIMKEAT